MVDKPNEHVEEQQKQERPGIGEPTAEQLEKWRAQYGRRNVIRLEQSLEDDEDLGEEKTLVIYCRKPNPQHLSRFANTAQKDAYKALRDMVFDTLLWPDAERVKAAIEDQPGLAIAIGGKLQQIAGTNADFTVKRF